MAATRKQELKVERVMHEFKVGGLRSSSGARVKKRSQAVAIALSESRQPRTNEKKRKRDKS